MNTAPWHDYAGREIRDRDTIRHPSGERGIVMYLPDEAGAEDQWRVDYGDGAMSRLCLQVGDKGRALRDD